jgi:hypothetical protein
VELITRLRRIIRPYIPPARERLRKRIAQRVLHFLRSSSSANMAVVAVRRFKTSVDRLQR